MSGVSFRMPSNAIFFNTKEIEDHVQKAEQKVLSRFGFLTRKDAKSSMRRRKKGPSDPGKTPRVVTGLLKNFIFFSYDKFKQSVVTGPVRLSGFKNAGEAPENLEYGGSFYVGPTTYKKRLKPGRDSKGRFLKSRIVEVKTKGGFVKVKPRPFMNPAFERQIDEHMPGLWKDSIV